MADINISVMIINHPRKLFSNILLTKYESFWFLLHGFIDKICGLVNKYYFIIITKINTFTKKLITETVLTVFIIKVA